MKIFIGCSSKNELDKKYFEITKEVCSFLSRNHDLVFGADTNGMMGICYHTFRNNKRKINGIVNECYQDCLKEIDCDYGMIVKDTFDRTQKIYYESDMFLILPGGIGTFGEIFGILENLRCEKDGKKLIVYNYDHYYDEVEKLLNKGLEEKFIRKKDLDYIKFVDNIYDLKREFD